MLVLIVGTGISQSISSSNSKTLDSMWATARQWKVVGGKSRATWDDHPSRGSRIIWRLCHQVRNHNCFSFPARLGKSKISHVYQNQSMPAAKVPWQHMLLLERWLHKYVWTCRASHPSLQTFPGDCILNGTWKLLFTDAADATFRRGKRTEPWRFTCSVILNRNTQTLYIYNIYTTIYFLYTYICITVHGWLEDHWIPTSSRHMVAQH